VLVLRRNVFDGGGEDVEMGVEVQVIAEGLDGGDGGEFSFREIEPDAHPIAQALNADSGKVVEELAPFAKNAAQGPRHGKHELAVGHLEADLVGDPVAQGADPVLVTAGSLCCRVPHRGLSD